ncbi:unnamed protein product [Adineta steineri]|uniref:Uncharacterized protein n=1 Tax=Adineta steineri TaxID=433720 RepID=A0A815RJF9_9BILA|nr:unnamed protein product [Adineta steineri]CAF4035099.1 unnamed protein product [Adineta steineri]
MAASTNNERHEHISTYSSSLSPRLLSPSLGVSHLSSPLSSTKQQEKASSLLSSDVIPAEIKSSSFIYSASSDEPTSNPSNLSAFPNELPTQPKRATYPLNTEKRYF